MGLTATATRSIEAAGVGNVKHDVGERGARTVTPVREILLSVTVEYVVSP